MKKIASLLMIVFMAVAFMPWNVFAEEGYHGACGENLNWTLEDGVLTVSGTGDMAIDYDTSWYPKNGEITKVVVENGVTSISNSAFEGIGINSVSLPPSLKTIGERAFAYTYLSSVSIPNNVTIIGESAFYGCNNLNDVVLGSKLQTIGDYAFSCTKANCSFPDTLRTIGQGAFDNSNMQGDVKIPDGVTSIGFGAFQDCNSMKTFTIPKSVTSVGDALATGNNFTQYIVDANNLNYCSVDGILYNKDKTMILSCPQGKSGSVTIVDGVKSVQSRAFYNNTSLEELNIPSTVRVIKSQAFTGLVTRINIYRCSSPNTSAEAFEPLWQNKPEVHVPKGATGYTNSPWNQLSISYDIDQQLAKHDYKEWVITEAATCIANGSREMVCAGCNDTITEVIPPTGHLWNSSYTVDKPTTCKEEGSESIHCSVCDAIKEGSSRAIAKTDHKYGDWTITNKATCTTDGSREKVCADCGDKVTEAIPSTGHKWKTEYTVDAPATCTEEGSESIHCSVCDAIKEGSSRAIAKTDHKYGNWTITNKATCTTDGSREKVCADCGDKVTEVLPATGHNETTLPTIAATCTEAGKTAGKQCSVCGKIMEPQTDIPAIGHKYGEWEITKEASEIAPGIESRTCANCGDKETREIAQLKPTLVAVKISKPKAAKKSATIKWKKVSKKNLKKIKKIEIQYSTDKNFTENVKSKYASAKKTSYKIKKLKSKKKYYVRIRAYTNSGGQVHVSKWSAKKSFKVK